MSYMYNFDLFYGVVNSRICCLVYYLIPELKEIHSSVRTRIDCVELDIICMLHFLNSLRIRQISLSPAEWCTYLVMFAWGDPRPPLD